MAEVERFAVSLSIGGDSLIPDEVSQLLCAEPSTAYKKDGQWFTPNGKPVVGRTGLWVIARERRKTTDLDSLISELLSKMTDNLDIWDALADRFSPRLFCGVFLDRANEGFGLSAKTMKALALRNIRFEADIYSGNDDGDEPDGEISALVEAAART